MFVIPDYSRFKYKTYRKRNTLVLWVLEFDFFGTFEISEDVKG